MKKPIFFLIFLLLLPMDISQASPTESIDDIAKALVTYFPKVSGKVTAVDHDSVTILSENETGLSAGVMISVFREGEPFYHPVTHVVLGRFEEGIAQLEVEKIEPALITARMIQPTNAIMPGSLIRLTAARIPIGMTSGTTEEELFLIDELRSALEDTGRFSVTQLPPDAAPDGNIYSITLTVNPPPAPVKIIMQNVKTGKIVSEFESLLQASNERDSIFESLQYKLFEKRQRGISAK